MGVLRVNTVSGIETTTPVTGSVSFTGVAGTHLSISTSTDFSFQNADFTIEFWINTSNNARAVGSFSQTPFAINGEECRIYLRSDNGTFGFKYKTNNSTTSFGCPENQWTHIALVRQNSVIKFFKDGVPDNTNTLTDSSGNTNGVLTIGSGNVSGDGAFLGFISNLRIRRGTAGYTTNFTPPIYELEPIQDTVLLCCQSGVSTTSLSFAGIGTTGPGTLTANGSVSASSTSPGLVRNYTFGTQFGGVAKFDTFGYFVPPSGTTEQRGRGRGLFGGGDPGTGVNTIAYINIQSQGNAQDFGDLTIPRLGAGGCSSITRGVFGAGFSGSNQNRIDYITIATTGNAITFGDLTTARHESGACSSSTRGVWGGGTTPTNTNLIEFVTLASLGNATSFGNLTVTRRNITSAQSPTRGIFFGGRVDPAGTAQNVIDFITFASAGSATDFGDLATTRARAESVSNSVRAVCIGGENPTAVTTMEFITIATLGNAQNFGTASSGANNANNGASNPTRGVFYSAFLSPASVNTMEYVTIAATGNSVDFGDLTYSTTRTTAFSDSHGGISE